MVSPRRLRESLSRATLGCRRSILTHLTLPPRTPFPARIRNPLSLSCILPPQIVQIGVVGVPNLCNEVQLRDFDEAGYKADGTGEHAEGRPQGEVCLRGPNVFKGYCELGRAGLRLRMRWCRVGDTDGRYGQQTSGRT